MHYLIQILMIIGIGVGTAYGIHWTLKSKILIRDDSKKWKRIETLSIFLVSILICNGINSVMVGVGVSVSFLHGLVYQSHRNYKDLFK